MKEFATALTSGLIGALIAAFLSYKVRLKAKCKEDEEERKRLALVNFLLLTDVVASDFFMKDFIDRLSKLSDFKAEGFGLSHAVAVFLASKIEASTDVDLSQARMLLKPFIASAITAIDKFEIRQRDLGHLSEVTIYAYHRHRAAGARLQTALAFFDVIAERGDAKLITASSLHSLFQTYRSYADSAGLLRAGLRKAGALSDAYSVQCLVRSFNAMRADTAAALEQNEKLALAKKAADATSASSVTEVTDSFAAKAT